MKKAVWVTINTDAGYSYKYRVGTYAYWIKGTGKHLHGSGIFKEKHKGPSNTGPYEMEMKAIINAVAAILNTDHPPIIGLVFNRDNIRCKSSKNGADKLQKFLYNQIRKVREHAIKELGMGQFAAMTAGKKYAQFRHVKAHNGTPDSRSWVNDWCDRQCKIQFSNWKKQESARLAAIINESLNFHHL